MSSCSVVEVNKLPLMLSINKAAEISSLSPWTIRKWIRDGKISSKHKGSRVLIPTKKFIEFLEED